MTQHYAFLTFFQYIFVISSFVAGENFVFSVTFKPGELNSRFSSDLFASLTASQKVQADTTNYAFFKTQTSFVNYYLDFALSRGGGGGGGDDDWVAGHYALPII